MQQLLLDVKLNKKEKYLAEDFLPLSNSFNAHRIIISALANNLSGAVILGSEGVGKTHLLNLCNQFFNNKDEVLFLDNISNLTAVDFNIKYLLIDNISELSAEQEELLFHWYNHLKEVGGKLILVLSGNIDDVITLKDLKSRLLTLQQAIIEHPNDKDLEIFILKQAFDRQIELSDDVLGYIILRAERNFTKVDKLIDIIDEESLRKKRKITIPLIKEFLN